MPAAPASLHPPRISGTFRTDDAARAAYAEGAGIYRIVPQAVAIPAGISEVVRLVRWARQERLALIPRGAGSAMGGGNVGDGVILDLTSLAERPLEVRPDRLAARTGASVTWGELHRAAGDHGLRLPPDPSSGKWATLGGMVSTNAAGARSVRFGSVRPWVTAIELVTADAERIRLQRGKPAPSSAAVVQRFATDAEPAIRSKADAVRAAFPHTRKNSSGYALDAWLRTGDLLDLVIGAEGTLGIVTAVEWRLDRVPRASAALRIALTSLDQLPDAVSAVLDVEPSAVELIDRTFLDLLEEESAPGIEAVLLVELEAEDEHTLGEQVRQAERAVRPHAAQVETALDPADVRRLWALRHAASPILARLPESRRSLQVIEDGCVPLASLGAYIRAVRAAAARQGIGIVLFGHAGDGHLHCNLLPDTTADGWEARTSALLDEVSDAVAGLSGTLSGEHGDGRLRAPLVERMFGQEVTELFRRVKHAFDPDGIFNPGIKLGSAPSVARLKVGREAAPIPARIAAGLRAIEREGGYAIPRLRLLD
jgi:FAD/FMN-containing dehydrogenase